MIRVFIASSSEQILKDKSAGLVKNNFDKTKFAFKLCQELRKKPNIEVTPWWEDKCFTSGQHVLNDLLRISKENTVAICLFGKDDSLKNSTTDSQYITRDNVLIEYGIFVSKLGKNNVHIIKEDNSVKTPYDTGGKKILIYSKGVDAIINDLFRTSTAYTKKKTQNGCFTFFVNENVKVIPINRNYPTGTSKVMYVGSKAANLWHKIEESSEYMIDEATKDATKNFFETLGNDKKQILKQVENIISFGPGAGIMDKRFIENNLNKLIDKKWKYILVDFNEHLAFLSAKTIRNHFSNNEVSFAIVDDFEKHPKEIGSLIKEKITCTKEVSLFMIVGGTFSNLAGEENSLFQNFNAWLDYNDLLLVDAFIKGSLYDSNNDPKRDFDKLPESYKNWFKNAVGKLSENYNGEIPIKREKVCSSIITPEQCSVPKTDINRYRYCLKEREGEEEKKKNTLLLVKRYDYTGLKASVENHFDIIAEFSSLSDDEMRTKKTGRAIFLLKKKNLE